MNIKGKNNADISLKNRLYQPGANEKDWHPADVIAALHKSGMTMMKLAKSHGLTSANTFSKALRSSFPIAERRIAEALGVHPKEIWPSRYFSNGEPRPRGCRAIQSSASENNVKIEDSEAKNQKKERRKKDRRSTTKVDS